MKETYGVLRKLQNESSKSGKQAIIENNLDNELFVEVMQFLVNPYIVTGISTKKINKAVYTSDVNLDTLSDLLNYLKENKTGRDYDIAVCMNFLRRFDSYEDVDITMQIITKTLKIGIDSLWNKTVPEEYRVPEFGCMLAKSADDHEDKIKGNFVLSEKKDGLRVVIVKENGQSKPFTRTGKEYEGLEEILQEINSIDYLDDMVFDGELIADSEGSTNEVFSETQSLARSKGKNKQGLKFHIFDMLPLKEFQEGKSKENAIKRKQNISRLMNDIDFKHIVEVKPLYIGNDKDMIQQLMIDFVEPNGLEGLMVNLDKPYVTKRTDALLKVKKFKSCDVMVIGFEEGIGKYEGSLGAIIVDYKGNSCGVGTGLSDSIRQEIWNNKDKWISRVIETKYFEESMDSKTGLVSMRFPVFIGLREEGKEVSYN